MKERYDGNEQTTVLRELTMTDRGEAYITMEKREAARPQKSFRLLPWMAKMENSATAAKTARTDVRSPVILPLSFCGVNARKIIT